MPLSRTENTHSLPLFLGGRHVYERGLGAMVFNRVRDEVSGIPGPIAFRPS